jgi:hypothetical protein
MKYRYIAAAILTLIGLSAQAKKIRKHEPAPKMIFVQLPVYQNRVDLFKSKNAHSKLVELQKDRDIIIQKEMMDFNDNFHYCPVYYFMDTNFHKIIAGKFDGIFLDKNLNNIDPPANPNDDYFIVTFGYPIQRTIDTNSRSGFYLEPSDIDVRKYQKMVVMNKKGGMVKEADLNGSYRMYRRLQKPRSDYIYESPDFDIYYRPYAKHLEEKLKRFYGKK